VGLGASARSKKAFQVASTVDNAKDALRRNLVAAVVYSAEAKPRELGIAGSGIRPLSAREMAQHGSFSVHARPPAISFNPAGQCKDV
jgi:hypothetical protein